MLTLISKKWSNLPMVQNSQKGCGVKSNEGFKDSLYSLFDVKTEEAKVQTQLLNHYSLLFFFALYERPYICEIL